MSPEDIQLREKEARLQIENAIVAIASQRAALEHDRRLDPDLIAHNIERYQEIMRTHLMWLNTHGFVASVSNGILTVQSPEQEAEGGSLSC